MQPFNHASDVGFAAPGLDGDSQVRQTAVVFQCLVPGRTVRNDPLRPPADVRGLNPKSLEIRRLRSDRMLETKPDRFPVGRLRPQPDTEYHVGQDIHEDDDPEPLEKIALIIDGEHIDLRLIDLTDPQRILRDQSATSSPVFACLERAFPPRYDLLFRPMLPKAALQRIERDDLQASGLKDAVDGDQGFIQRKPFPVQILLIQGILDDVFRPLRQAGAATGIIPQKIADQTALAVLSQVNADHLARSPEPGGKVGDGRRPRFGIRAGPIKDAVEVPRQTLRLQPAGVAERIFGGLPHRARSYDNP